jgi:PadR family transcriptional regulator PadR
MTRLLADAPLGLPGEPACFYNAPSNIPFRLLLSIDECIYGDTIYGDICLMLDREVKRGSTEMLILALVEDRPRHGYEIAKLIEERSDGVLQFHVASLYPLLYRLEKRELIQGRWVEKAGQRRRRYYRLTAQGRKVLADQRQTWADFFTALDRVAKIKPA